MEMTYKQLEKALISYFKIKPDREGTFRSRIKQLQRLEFPSGVNVGRGTKMTYTGEHLFKLTVAFELLSSGLPALAATQLVELHWPAFQGAFRLAAIQKRFGRRGPEIPLFLKIDVQTMSDIRIARSWEWPRPTDVQICDPQILMAYFEIGKAEGKPLRTTLAASDLFTRLLKVANEQAGIMISEYNNAFVEWLPQGAASYVSMKSPYPDRSNIEMRRRLHRTYDNDPESLSPDAEEEAKAFMEDLSDDIPF